MPQCLSLSAETEEKGPPVYPGFFSEFCSRVSTRGWKAREIERDSQTDVGAFCILSFLFRSLFLPGVSGVHAGISRQAEEFFETFSSFFLG